MAAPEVLSSFGSQRLPPPRDHTGGCVWGDAVFGGEEVWVLVRKGLQCVGSSATRFAHVLGKAHSPLSGGSKLWADRGLHSFRGNEVCLRVGPIGLDSLSLDLEPLSTSIKWPVPLLPERQVASQCGGVFTSIYL
jgi:hypothetical protein